MTASVDGESTTARHECHDYYCARRDSTGAIRLSGGRGELIAAPDHTRADVQRWHDLATKERWRAKYAAVLRLLDLEGETVKTITIPAPNVPHGPHGVPPHVATAGYLHSGAARLDAGYPVGGSNLTATAAQIMRDVADALLRDDEAPTASAVEHPTALTIYGASDDLVEVEGPVVEEFELGPDHTTRVRLTAPDGQSLDVVARFGAPHGWTLAVQTRGHYPSWPIRFTERPEYEGDPAVIIEAPEGTTVEDVTR